MKLQKKIIISLIVMGIMLSASVFLVTTPANSVQAATRPTLSTSELEIGIGIYGNDYIYFNKTDDRYLIAVNNSIDNAKYSFKTSNKEIVTVKASGAKGYLTGIKKGSAIITCIQTLKNKTTIVGRCKVIVHESSFYSSEWTESLPLGSGSLGSMTESPIIIIDNRIPEAKYTYDTGSENLKIEDTKEEYPQYGYDYYIFKQTFTAKKAGTYKVTIKETYNGKTRELGTINVIVHDMKIKDNLTLPTGATLTIDDIIDYSKIGMKYYFEGVGFDASVNNANSIAYVTESIDYYSEDYHSDQVINCVKDGTVKFNVYEGEDKDNVKLIGSVTIRITKDYVAFEYDHYATYVVEKDQDPYSCYIFLYTAPNSVLDSVTVADESILTINEVEATDYGYLVYLIPLKEGTTTIEVKYRSETTSCAVTVYATKEEYYNRY